MLNVCVARRLKIELSIGFRLRGNDVSEVLKPAPVVPTP